MCMQSLILFKRSPTLTRVRCCRSNCIASNGLPVDLANSAAYFGLRNFVLYPYGALPTDFYLDR